ncbi:uncharacterized protein C8Q71DRAFT_711760, partial [Rhodofomes roseus]
EDVQDESEQELSDGRSALREVEEREAAEKRRTGARGPINRTLQHWEPAVATFDPIAGKRWTFQCRFCGSKRSFERSVDSDNWADETKRPVLGNLTLHTAQKHKEAAAAAAAAAEPVQETNSAPAGGGSTSGGGFTVASAKLMEGYLKEGKLNPKVEPTQRGFLQVFAAWIVEDDLPFTTGESPGLARVFRYMQSKFLLPTDTTVRNTIATIFAKMHAELVKELAAIGDWVAERDDLEALTLLPEDWNFLQQLANLLSHFTHVTHIMSKQSMPTLPWVLPMFDHMKTALTNVIASPSTKPALAVAAQAGLTKLEQYYTKAKECQYNVIATGIKLGSEEKARAEVLFEHVFRKYELKLPKAADVPARPAPVATPSSFLDTPGSVSTL